MSLDNYTSLNYPLQRASVKGESPQAVFPAHPPSGTWWRPPPKIFPANPPIAPVTAELRVPITRIRAGTSPSAKDNRMPTKAHIPPAVAPPAARPFADLSEERAA